MSFARRPRPSFVDKLERLPGRDPSRWRDPSGQLYEYDGEHGGEFEVYNKRGKHLGAADAISGALIKPAVKGRTIDV